MGQKKTTKKEKIFKIFNELGEASLHTIYHHYQNKYHIPREELKDRSPGDPIWQHSIRAVVYGLTQDDKLIKTERGIYKLKGKRSIRDKTRPFVGPRTDISGLIYEPVNENGVIFLFGKYHKSLGIEYIEAIQYQNPDAIGKRKGNRRGTYEHVNIEFEFKCSNFQDHKHDADYTDIIVCWENDWPDCPIEVIELKTELKSIRRKSNPSEME